CFDASIGSAVLFGIHIRCQGPSEFSSEPSFFTDEWGCTHEGQKNISPTLFFWDKAVFGAIKLILTMNTDRKRAASDASKSRFQILEV
ncbi:MAG: hypothetical protein ACXVCM_20640, partial [Ktedonobacteraceae bacterium]